MYSTVSVMKLLQFAYCNYIYIGLLLHSFMVVTSSLKYTKLHSSCRLFLTLRIPYLGKLCWGKMVKLQTSDEDFPQNFQKSGMYKKVLVKFSLLAKFFPDKLFPN